MHTLNSQIAKFIYIILIFTFQANAAVENSPSGSNSPPKILAEYSESKDRKIEVPEWIINSQWIWVPAYEYNLVATPVLRIVVSVPFNFEIVGRDLGVQIITEEILKDSSPGKKKVIFDIPFYYKKVKIKIKEKGKLSASLLSLFITPTQKDSLFIHYSCFNLGLSFKSNALTTSDDLTNVAVTCLHEKQNIFINIQHEAHWSTFLERNPQRLKLGKFRGIITYNMEGKDYPKNGDLQDFYILDNDKRKVLEVSIKSDGRIFPKLYFEAGVAPVFMHYKETGTDVSLNSSLLKILGKADYLLSPSQYFLSAYADITPVTFYNSENELKRASFSTLDFSFMRKFLATKAELSRHSLGLGWVYWHMSVNSTGWGINYVVGPELVYSYIKNKPNRKENKISLKVSPLLNGTNGFTNNRYIDFQYAYELTKPGTMDPIFIFLQATNMSFQESSERKMSFMAGTLGILKAF